MRAAAAALGAAAGLSIAYLLFEAQWLRRVERSIALSGLPAGFEGLTLAHISDMHAGFRCSLNMRATRRAVELVRAARPDLICITGDLAGGAANGRALRDQLARLRAPLGVYAVLGNHDHGESKVPWVVATDLTDVGDYGVRLLQNECVALSRGSTRIELCGIDDWKHGYADLQRVRRAGNAGARHSAPAVRILLSHYGQAALEAEPGDFDLTLSGDTHGGQLCLPGPRGMVMLSQPTAPFKDGLYACGGRRIHVTRGIGTSLLPFRFLCRPEVVVLRLMPSENASPGGTRSGATLA